MTSDAALAPQSSNSSFRVYIENHADGELQPLAGGDHFESGDYGKDGNAVSVKSYQSGPVPQAFFVQGKAGAFGVEGSVKYIVDEHLLLNIQFNSDYPDKPGHYFYAGLQPRNPQDDPTAFYVEIVDIPPQIPPRMHAFTPRIILRPNAAPEVKPLLQFRSGIASYYALHIKNRSGEIMTLNEVKAPLDESFQPAFAATIIPDIEGYDQLLATWETGSPSVESPIDVVYNLAHGAQINIKQKRYFDRASAAFSGSNTGQFDFLAEETTVKFADPNHRYVDVRITVTSI